MRTQRPNLRCASFRSTCLWIAVATALSAPCQVWGADIDDVSHSSWNSTYQDNDGTFAVKATVHLRGESGTYKVPGGETGTLTDIRYAYLTSGANRKVGVYGTWELRGKSGGFTFRVTGDGQGYSGTWAGDQNQRGTWSGSRR